MWNRYLFTNPITLMVMNALQCMMGYDYKDGKYTECLLALLYIYTEAYKCKTIIARCIVIECAMYGM